MDEKNFAKLVLAEINQLVLVIKLADYTDDSAPRSTAARIYSAAMELNRQKQPTKLVVLDLKVAGTLSEMLHVADMKVEWTDAQEAAWTELTAAIQKVLCQ